MYLQILPSVQSCLISIKEDTTFVTYMSTRAIWSKLLSLESTPSQTVAFSQVQSGSRTNCGGWAMMYCMRSLNRLDRYSNTDMFTGAVLFSWKKEHKRNKCPDICIYKSILTMSQSPLVPTKAVWAGKRVRSFFDKVCMYFGRIDFWWNIQL